MKRTNLYLDAGQVDVLRRLGELRGVPMAALIREAVDSWLATQGAVAVPEDEWGRRFDALLARREKVAAKLRPFDDSQVESDVNEAIREVRRDSARSS